ncbi:proteinase inhibitor I4, serpin [Candidatus Vecturithrix granuli]|uniref:Proteinase inhibitor I4, serpin n=1 Tax=Vecturithrix granuli TaxID=1499967 RepID=A0A081C1Q4_VECG1|nr:proteinase inhibitor I4, serpin [Candidatus Vecturithrix granuli]
MRLTQYIFRVFICGLQLIIFIGGSSSTAIASEELAVDQLVEGNNRFALQLYQKLRTPDGNLFFSPYSISSAIAMTYAGARGETATQMAETFHFQLEQDALHLAFANLATQFQNVQESGNVVFKIANALWIQEDFDLLDAFLDVVKEYYQAGLFQVNFQEAYENVRADINAWVAEQTNQKIKDLLAPGTLSNLTRLVLTNAIYFKGDWAAQFDKEETQEESFWLNPEKETKLLMMHRKDSFKYAEDERIQVLQLPYAGEEISMVVLLPRTKDGLVEMETQLTFEDLIRWIDQSSLREVEVFLPKFTLTSQFSLSDTLKAMGMCTAFSEQADFSGMEASKSLSISDVIHKAFVEVNEEGTEVAAATAVIIGVTSVAEPQPIPVFRADHPFLFLIRDNQSGSILFIGKIMNPAS